MPYSPAQPSTFRIAASAARTTAFTSSTFRPPRDVRGVRVYINATAKASTPSVTWTIQVYDYLGAAWHDVVTSAALTDAGKKYLEIGVGIGAVTNVSAPAHVGKGFRVISTPSDSDALTYSISGEWLF